MNMKKSIACAAGLLAALALSAGEKRYVAFGHEFQDITPEVLLSNVGALDATALDGIGFGIRAPKPYDWRMGTNHLFDGPLWNRKAFAGYIPGFRQAFRHRSLRHCFLTLMRAPYKRVPWEDDAAWGHAVSNFASVAWFAKRAGFRGLCIDTEDYHQTRQFFRIEGDLPYDELVKLARRRGQEMFKAVFGEFPDATVLSYWFFSTFPGVGYAHAADPAGCVREAGDLWPAFMNGMLDVAPPSARFVDGDEKGYDYEAERGDFWRAAVEQRQLLEANVAEENRAKFRLQMMPSFGIYLDKYVNPPTNRHYAPPSNGSRLRRFVQNLDQATEAAGEYVWFWNEKDCWVKWNGDKILPKVVSRRTYDEIYPGISAMMKCLKDRSRLPADLPENLCTPEKVGRWSDGKVKGSLVRAGDEFVATGVERGGFSVRREKVLPGDVYGVRFRFRGEKTSLGVSWKSEGKWIPPGVGIASGPADAQGWRTGEATVVIPPRIDTLVLALGVNGQGPDESCRFRDIEIYHLGVDRPGQLDSERNKPAN